MSRMAEYSLYFGTHSAHKANAWTLRGLWLKSGVFLFKTKGLTSFSYKKQNKTQKQDMLDS